MLFRGGVKCNFIYYYGRRYGTGKDIFWRNADIFVFPTFYPNECFPLVCLEAMEWRLPIVSTDEGGIPDVIIDGENGFIVPCGRNGNAGHGPSAAAIADALERLITDPELRRSMGENGYRMFKKDFTLQAFERKFVEGLEWAMKH